MWLSGVKYALFVAFFSLCCYWRNRIFPPQTQNQVITWVITAGCGVNANIRHKNVVARTQGKAAHAFPWYISRFHSTCRLTHRLISAHKKKCDGTSRSDINLIKTSRMPNQRDKFLSEPSKQRQISNVFSLLIATHMYM